MTQSVPTHAQGVLSPDDFELTGVELISETVSVRGEFQADAAVANNVTATLSEGSARVRLELARTPDATLRWLAANGCRTRCSGLTLRGQVVVSPVTGRAALAVQSASKAGTRAPAANPPAAVASAPTAKAASTPATAPPAPAAAATLAPAAPVEPAAGNTTLPRAGAAAGGRGPAYDISRLDMGWLSLCGKCLNPEITGAWGLGTARAEAEGRITPEMAYGHCINWTSEEACESQRPERVDTNAEQFTEIHRATADCTRGIITTAWGESYTQAGRWPPGSWAEGRTRWRDKNGDIVGDDHASNGLAISQNWEVLCLE